MAKAKQRAIKQSDSIHHCREYQAVSNVAVCGVMDQLVLKLESTYASFPRSVRGYARAHSEEFEGLHSIKGEQQYLNWLIDGLLKLMDEATGKGHTTDATRFAFEAGLLWSMSDHAQARRTQANIQATLTEARRLAVKSRAAKADQNAKAIRDEVDEILRGSPVPMTQTGARKALARKSHFKDGTPMVTLRTITAACAPKHKPKNR